MKNRTIKLFSIIIIGLFIIILPNAFANIYPVDNTTFDNDNRSYGAVNFKVLVTGNLSTYSCSLYLNNSVIMTNNSVLNNTEWNITKALSSNSYSYYFNCSNPLNSLLFNTTPLRSFFVNKPFTAYDFKQIQLYNNEEQVINLTQFFGIDDFEKDLISSQLINHITGVSLLSNSELKINISDIGNYTQIIKLNDDQNPTYEKTVKLNITIMPRFILEVTNNKKTIVTTNLPANATINLLIKGIYSEYICNISNEVKSLANNTLFEMNKTVTEYGTHTYEISCFPKSDVSFVNQITATYYIKQLNSKIIIPSEIYMNNDSKYERGDQILKDYDIVNDGNIPLNVTITSTNEDLKIDGDQNVSFSLDAGESRNIELKITVPYDIDSGINQVAKITTTAKNNAYGEKIVKTTTLYLFAPPRLDIDEFYMKSELGDDSIKTYDPENIFDIQKNVYTIDKTSNYLVVKPNDQVKIEVLVHARARLIDLSGELIMDEDKFDIDSITDEYDLDSGDERPLSFLIKIPYRVEYDRDYPFEIEITGRDKDYRTKQTVYIRGYVVIDKDRKQIYVNKIELNPDTLECYNVTYINTRIYNIGKYDQNIKYTITSSDYNLNIENTCDLDSYDRNNEDYCDISQAITVPAHPGLYHINLKIFDDDGNLIQGPFLKTVTVNECKYETQQTDQTSENEKTNQTVVVINSDINNTNIPTIDLSNNQDQKMNFSETITLVLIGVLSVTVVGMIIVLIKLIIFI